MADAFDVSAKFIATDAWGETRNYVCTYFDTAEGMEMTRIVQHRLTPAVMPLLVGVVADDVDAVAVAGEVSQDLADALFSEGSTELIRRILGSCHREGKRLADANEYNAAYRRNYYEPQAAAMEVLRVNGIFPPPAISEVWTTLMEMVGSIDLTGMAEAIEVGAATPEAEPEPPQT